ncbi:MAG: thiamine biosynthesis protein ThiS [Rhodocyclales bacterium]|nr:thiamine biosynthesis protein ThiS [Rhodocyclales bacterium]
MLQLTINGESRQFVSVTSISDLLIELSLIGKRVAVERNGEIVPRGMHAATALDSGDQLEIVVAVGGG